MIPFVVLQTSFSFDGGSGYKFEQSLSSAFSSEPTIVVEISGIGKSELDYQNVRVQAEDERGLMAQLCLRLQIKKGQPLFLGFNQGLIPFDQLVTGFELAPRAHAPAPISTKGAMSVSKDGFVDTGGSIIRDEVYSLGLSKWSKRLRISPIFLGETVDISASHIREETFLRCLSTALGGKITETDSLITISPDWKDFKVRAAETCSTAARSAPLTQEMSARFLVAAEIFRLTSEQDLKAVYEDNKSVRRSLEVSDEMLPLLRKHLELELATMSTPQRKMYEENIDLDRIIYEVKQHSCPIIGFKGKNGTDMFI